MFRDRGVKIGSMPQQETTDAFCLPLSASKAHSLFTESPLQYVSPKETQALSV